MFHLIATIVDHMSTLLVTLVQKDWSYAATSVQPLSTYTKKYKEELIDRVSSLRNPNLLLTGNEFSYRTKEGNIQYKDREFYINGIKIAPNCGGVGGSGDYVTVNLKQIKENETLNRLYQKVLDMPSNKDLVDLFEVIPNGPTDCSITDNVKGWYCVKCNRSFSPSVKECLYCNKENTIPNTASTFSKIENSEPTFEDANQAIRPLYD